MTTDVNQITLSGEVRKVFGSSVTKNGSANYSFAVKYKDGDFENQVVVNAYGKTADQLAEDELSEGDYVIVAGRLKEVRWQDKETQEWHGRHDIVPFTVVNVSEQESGGLD